MTRKEKIKLLTDIDRGRRMIGELLPKRVMVWMQKGQLYYNDQLQAMLTWMELQEYKRTHPFTEHLIVEVIDTGVPLAHSEDQIVP